MVPRRGLPRDVAVDVRRGAIGKLRAAARAAAFAWAGRADPALSARIDEDLQAQFAALGVAVDLEEAEDGESDDVAVWAINWQTVRAFLACATCWRVAVGLAGMTRLGLDYAGVDAMLRRRGFDDVDFADLQLMEEAALEAFGEVAEGN
ncbi:DUF1799 domain-containing protein [Jiella pacifica]|uniref:DUF1799 domain-containing protein n=1 Tax=Jiella pacifica TaxID=2696469 RepID=UPI00194031F6|nr:DUF1799 domain-containing protein [Jiella pacifica]